MTRLNDILPRTLGLAALAVVSPLAGFPALGILLAILGLTDAATDARRLEELRHPHLLRRAVTDRVVKWTGSDRGPQISDLEQLHAGVELAFAYFESDPLTIAKMVDGDFDLTTIVSREVASAQEWSRDRWDPWGDDSFHMAAERAIRIYCQLAFAKVVEAEPIMVPVIQALLRRPDSGGGDRDGKALHVALSAIKATSGETADGSPAQAPAIKAPTTMRKWVERWNDSRWLTQAGVMLMLLTLIAAILIPIVQWRLK